jgi:hypothetical protein|tara:strand:- start:34 stop:252 length:219 start_codon:yes stop_codon:yes gene_type:complete
MIESGGIVVISANTDGIVIKCPVNLQSEMEKIILKWEKPTQFITEETRYRAFIPSSNSASENAGTSSLLAAS